MISIIVPVYRTERYLNECVESILNQSHKDFELLLIDDGSPDNCPAMCDLWAKKDNRIRVFHKINGGVSSARNIGIKEAKGEYLAFVDSDDTLPAEALKLLLDSLKQNNVDLSIGSFLFQYNDKYLSHKSRLQAGKYKFHEILSDFIDDGTLSGFLLGSVCGGLYKKSILNKNDLHFVDGLKNNEDGLFNFEYALLSSSLYVLDSVVYNYRQYESVSKPVRMNENYGQKVFDYLNKLEWDKAEYKYEIQQLRREVSLAWWDILHFAKYYPFFQSISYIYNIIIKEKVRNGIKYMRVQKMNRYKRIVYYMMKYRLCFTMSCMVRFVIPLLQSRLAR